MQYNGNCWIESLLADRIYCILNVKNEEDRFKNFMNTNNAGEAALHSYNG